MATCEYFLRELVQRIEPTYAQKQGASKSHSHLRAVLDNGRFGNRIIDSYLSGSYARDTAIAPIDDVDIIIIVEPEGWINNSLLSFTKPSPDTVLSSFAAAIRYRYPASSVFGQRRSVRLELNHLDIDVVPAIEESGDIIWIPDRERGDWIKSAPRAHANNASKVNKQQGARFKPIVKLLKYWNSNIPSTASFKSFAVETMAIRLFSEVSMPSLESGLLLFFDFISKHHGFWGASKAYSWHGDYGMSLSSLGCNVPDASGTGSNTCAGVTGDRLKRFTQNAVWSRDAMLTARDMRSVDAAVNQVMRALKM